MDPKPGFFICRDESGDPVHNYIVIIPECCTVAIMTVDYDCYGDDDGGPAFSTSNPIHR